MPAAGPLPPALTCGTAAEAAAGAGGRVPGTGAWPGCLLRAGGTPGELPAAGHLWGLDAGVELRRMLSSPAGAPGSEQGWPAL